MPAAVVPIGVVLTDQISKGFNRLTKDVERGSKRMGKNVTSVGNIIKAVFVGNIIQSAIRNTKMLFRTTVTGSMEAAALVEKLEFRLSALAGSTEIAAKKMDLFEGFAATVPHSLDRIVEAGVQIEAFGANSEEWIAPISDLAFVMGVDLVEAANSFGRAFAGGAGAADVFREKGVLQIIEDFKGVDDITKLTLPEFRKAMLEAFSDPEGRIAGAAKRAADTWTGAMSMIGDAVFKAQTNIGEAITKNRELRDIFKEMTAFINDELTHKALKIFAETMMNEVIVVVKDLGDEFLDLERGAVGVLGKIGNAAFEVERTFEGFKTVILLVKQGFETLGLSTRISLLNIGSVLTGIRVEWLEFVVGLKRQAAKIAIALGQGDKIIGSLALSAGELASAKEWLNRADAESARLSNVLNANLSEYNDIIISASDNINMITARQTNFNESLKAAAINAKKAADEQMRLAQITAGQMAGGIFAPGGVGFGALTGTGETGTTQEKPSIADSVLPENDFLAMQDRLGAMEETLWDHAMRQAEATERINQAWVSVAGTIHDAMFTSIAAVVTGEMTMKQALGRMAAGAIDALSSQARVEALFQLAEGFKDLGNPATAPLAAAHFKSAALFGVVSGLGTIASALVSRSVGGGTEAGAGIAPRRNPTTFSGTNVSRDEAATTNVTQSNNNGRSLIIQIQGNVIGTTRHIRMLAEEIRKADRDQVRIAG